MYTYAPDVLRVGDGLVRTRGDVLPSAQMVGPIAFQYGNGDQELPALSGKLRNGTRRGVLRGKARPSAQMVGPVAYQYGNGDRDLSALGATLRHGETQVLRGTVRASSELRGHAGFQQGQVPWTAFSGVAVKGRGKYAFSTQTPSDRLLKFGPTCAPRVEPFVLGGVSSRDAKDFDDCC